MSSKNKTTKFISALLIVSMLLPTVLLSKPKQVNAAGWPVVDIPQTIVNKINGIFIASTSSSTIVNTGLHIKDFAAFLLKQILMRLAKVILARITQATINWINSGFHGSPLFLENPASFFKDIAKSEVRNLVDMIGYDTFRFPFGPQTALNVIASYKRQLAENAQYSLSKVINDPALLIRYRNDFNYGGWNGFLINTQYPQNNYLGFQGIIQQNLASRLEGTLQAPAQKIQSALQQGMGFLSPQKCPSNPKYNNGVNEFLKPSFKPKTPYNPNIGTPEYSGTDYAGYQIKLEAAQEAQREYDDRYEAEVAAEKAKWAETNTCPGGLVSTTPGAVVGSQITNALGSNLRQTELGAALGNSIDAIFDALINKLLDTGLNALAKAVTPGPSNDNWSYNGQTLGGNVSYNGYSAGALDINIPQQNVSITVNPRINLNSDTRSTIYDTSRTISGGTAPYGIDTPNNKTKTILVPGTSTIMATAQITRDTAGTTLTIHGIAKGNGSFVIQDSSIPAKKVTINVAVNNPGDLVASPANISVNINDTTTTAISGGEGDYRIEEKGPNFDKIAIAEFAGTNLVVTGTAKGLTWVVIQDSSTSTAHLQTVTVTITVNAPEDLVIKQGDAQVDNILVESGKSTTATISNGTAPYSKEQVIDATVATAEINGSTLEIVGATGATSGLTTAVIIKDSSSPVKIVAVNITIEKPSSAGTCTISGPKTELDCAKANGNWNSSDTSTGIGSNPQCGPNNRKAPCGDCYVNNDITFSRKIDGQRGSNITTKIQDVLHDNCVNAPVNGSFSEYPK